MNSRLFPLFALIAYLAVLALALPQLAEPATRTFPWPPCPPLCLTPVGVLGPLPALESWPAYRTRAIAR